MRNRLAQSFNLYLVLWCGLLEFRQALSAAILYSFYCNEALHRLCVCFCQFSTNWSQINSSSNKLLYKCFINCTTLGYVKVTRICIKRFKTFLHVTSLAKVSDWNSFRVNQNYSDSFRYLYLSQCESFRTNPKNVL